MPRAGDAFLFGELPRSHDPLVRINHNPADTEFDFSLEALLEMWRTWMIEIGLPLLEELTGIDLTILEPLLGGIGSPEDFINLILNPTGLLATIPAIVEAITGLIGGDLPFLNLFFGDFLGLLGNPTGLGSGSPTMPGLGSIPIFGPLFGLFGGASTGTQASSFFASLLSLLGNPGGMTSGTPTVPGLGSIPLFGPLLNLFGGASTGTQATNFFSSLLGLLGNPSGMTGGAPTIPGLSGIPLLGGVQTMVDGLFEKLTGVAQIDTLISDLLEAFSSIPATLVGGVGGPTSIGGSFQGIIDQWISGAVGLFGTGASLADLFNVSQQTASGSALGSLGWNVLGIRNNKPFWTGLLPTGVSNIPLPGTTSSTAPTFALTQSTATMDYHHIDEGSSKGVVSWIGSGVTSITHFFINIFRVDPATGLHTLVHASPNIVGDVSAALGSNIYTLNDGAGTNTPLPVVPGEVYGIEKSIRGAGTHNIVGAASWMNFDHPTVFPKRLASVRNSGTSAPPATIAAGSVTYAANIAFTEFAVAGSLDGHAPELRAFLDAGTTSTVVPSWADFAEVVVVGSGGDGASGSFTWGVNGKGGAKGVWGTGLWTKGTHFAAGDTISITTALPGGATSSATVNGNTVSGSGGADGSGWGTPTRGESPGNQSFGTPPQPYSGGVQQNSLGADGSTPGGGGAGGGYAQSGGAGAKGAVWIRFRQDTSSKTVTPPPATLTLTGGTPTITSTRVIQPAAASLTITGGTPVVGNTALVVVPAAASLAITGGQPTVTTTAPGVQYIDAEAQTGATLTTMPTHATGDMLLFYAFRSGSPTPPSLPAGCTNMATQTGTNCSARMYFKLAASSSETSGTATNATSVVCHVYSNVFYFEMAGYSASSSTVSYPPLTRTFPGTSWFVRFAGHRAATNLLTNTPAGYTPRAGVATAIRGMDSNGIAASDAVDQSQSVNVSSGWLSMTVEIAPP